MIVTVHPRVAVAEPLAEVAVYMIYKGERQILDVSMSTNDYLENLRRAGYLVKRAGH